MKAQAKGTISLSLGNAPAGVPLKGGNSSQRSLDLGTVSYRNGPSTLNVGVQKLATSFVVSTKFAMTVQDSTGNLAQPRCLPLWLRLTFLFFVSMVCKWGPLLS